MGQKKKLEDLTFKDNFMFAAVMQDEENCKAVLERILEIPIAHVVVDREKSIIYNPEYHGVRLDIFAKDENNTHYNVEMQVATQHVLKRARYYHDQIDMELLTSGEDYENLPNSYVIFICNFDPLGLKKYRYTKKDTLEEDQSYEYDDGIRTIFLNTKGANEEEVPKELVTFLKFVGAELAESKDDYKDSLVNRLQSEVQRVKDSRDMKGRYMLFEELMRDEFKAGKEEGRIEGRIENCREMILDLLSDIGEMPESLRSKLTSIQDIDSLKELSKKAAKATSVEAFESEVNQYV